MAKQITINGQVWTKEIVKEKLLQSAKAIQTGIVQIYAYQTQYEKQAEATFEANGVGFNGSDAFILSSFAQQIEKGRTLSEKQLAIAKKKMPKYAGQLFKLLIHKHSK